MCQESVAFPTNNTKKKLRIVLNKFVSLILLLSDEKDRGHLQFLRQWSATCKDAQKVKGSQRKRKIQLLLSAIIFLFLF